MKKLLTLGFALTLALVGIMFVSNATVDVHAMDFELTRYGHVIQVRDLDGNYTFQVISKDDDANFDGLVIQTYYGQCTDTFLEDEGRSGFPINTSLVKTDVDTYERHVTVIGGTQTYAREEVYEFDYSFTYTVTI